MAELTAGIVATSLKRHELRVPMHPDHFGQIPAEVRGRLVFETGYGAAFGVGDERTASLGAAVAGRDEILRDCDIVVLPKPLREDLKQMKPGGVLWGWVHCVQNAPLTQVAIDRRLTLIAWESMNRWSRDGSWQSHVFSRNNEIAGYAAVLDALRHVGVDGHYGPRRKAVVIGGGSVARGALDALAAVGFEDVTVLAPPPAEPSGAGRRQLRPGPDGWAVTVGPDGAEHPAIDDLAEADLIVNGILQDTDSPMMFVPAEHLGRLKPRCLIVDVSCDTGMGFAFAAPTTFDDPIRQVGQVRYYGVDHTPSYLWDSASWEISAALLPFLPAVMAGPRAVEADETLRRAIEVRDGVVLNPKILTFQHRSPQYPHPRQQPGRGG